jgi:S-adenosylmethionine-diacylglycerol 3-amino-3-carboxypropyl transferase
VRLRDRAFQRAFSRLFVYNILFEDAEVDERFLEVGEDSSVLGISGAGCGIAGLVSGRPRRIDAVDINPHHLALTALKVAGAQHMKSYTDFYDMFGRGWQVDPKRSVANLSEHLPRWMRPYWARHADRFKRSLYLEGLTSKTLLAMRKMAGLDADWLRKAIATPKDQREKMVDDALGPLLNKPVIKAFVDSPIQLVALGVNFTQRDRMLEQNNSDMTGFFLDHVRRIANTELETNWFAWFVIANQFNHERQDAVPPYLRKDRHERSYGAPTTMRYHRRNIFDVLEDAGPNTWSHFMFCDAPDWMPPAVQQRLLEQVYRTSRDGGVMLYRSVEDEDMVSRLGFEKKFQLMEEATRIGSELDRSRQYRRVNFYRIVH